MCGKMCVNRCFIKVTRIKSLLIAPYVLINIIYYYYGLTGADTVQYL